MLLIYIQDYRIRMTKISQSKSKITPTKLRRIIQIITQILITFKAKENTIKLAIMPKLERLSIALLINQVLMKNHMIFRFVQLDYANQKV